MKTFVVLAVSMVLASIFFCSMAMGFPPMPDDLQMVQPYPSLPKELSAFFGKWESAQFFLIVAKIDNEKASLYIWQNATSMPAPFFENWFRQEAKVKIIKLLRDKHLTSLQAVDCPLGYLEFSLEEENLQISFRNGTIQSSRVP